MDLNGYFDPVSLERPPFEYLEDGEAFSHYISVHTPDQPIRELDNHQVAVVGVPEDTNAFIKGSKDAPDEVRSKLYQLRKINRNLRIYDLGNIKNTGSVNATYFALRDVILELMERNIITIIFGGSQDISRGAFLALEKHEGLHQVLTIDSMLDFSSEKDTLNSRNYLNQLMDPSMNERFSFTNLGHQAYFVTENQLNELERSYLESIRLGEARKNLQAAEPLIRDSEFIGIDLGAVRHADAPGASIPSPNGFFGDELCQISRYAGLSEQVSIMGFFELNPVSDTNGQTAHLTAQAVWYFLEGLSHRISENPVDTPEHIKKFIVNLNAAGHDIIFHKSTISERWWMEIPVKNPVTGYNFFVSCSYEDYQLACNQEIPDRWWRYLHRLGNETG
ncbi:MAG: formimidoylglutamase [Bacteroidales bacterium]|nr:formimidoylglutamase [Bacteroidales bacterium]